MCVLIKLPIYIFIDSFIHNRMDSWSNGLKDYNLLLPLFTLMCKFSLVQPEEAPASWLCLSLACRCCSMRTFLLPDTARYSSSSAGSGRLPGALVPLVVPALLLNLRSHLQSHGREGSRGVFSRPSGGCFTVPSTWATFVPGSSWDPPRASFPPEQRSVPITQAPLVQHCGSSSSSSFFLVDFEKPAYLFCFRLIPKCCFYQTICCCSCC